MRPDFSLKRSDLILSRMIGCTIYSIIVKLLDNVVIFFCLTSTTVMPLFWCVQLQCVCACVLLHINRSGLSHTQFIYAIDIANPVRGLTDREKRLEERLQSSNESIKTETRGKDNKKKERKKKIRKDRY